MKLSWEIMGGPEREKLRVAAWAAAYHKAWQGPIRGRHIYVSNGVAQSNEVKRQQEVQRKKD